jgi:hypothetical protein
LGPCRALHDQGRARQGRGAGRRRNPVIHPGLGHSPAARRRRSCCGAVRSRHGAPLVIPRRPPARAAQGDPPRTITAGRPRGRQNRSSPWSPPREPSSSASLSFWRGTCSSRRRCLPSMERRPHSHAAPSSIRASTSSVKPLGPAPRVPRAGLAAFAPPSCLYMNVLHLSSDPGRPCQELLRATDVELAPGIKFDDEQTGALSASPSAARPPMW